MSLPAGVRLRTREEFTVRNPTPRNHHGVAIPGGLEVVTTGKDGVCILLDGSLVPGIEVTFPNMNPPDFVVPLESLELIKK